MAKVLEMPKLSPTMTEGQLSLWHKKEGDPIAVDDLLAEVETDKATMEFRAFDKGTLLKILVPAGSNVLLGQPVAIMGAAGEDVAQLVASLGAAHAKKPEPEPEPEPVNDRRSTTTATTTATPTATPTTTTTTTTTPTSTPTSDRVKASPYVRKVAREREIDLHAVPGSGPGGRIIARDLERLPLASAAAPTALATRAEAPEIRPLSMMRKTIARRLTEAKQTIPHFYLSIDVDAAPLSRLREQINDDLAQSAGKGGDDPPPRISLNDLVVKACAIGLVRVPECNASFTPEAIVYHRRVDISVAVSVPEGLLTPVVRSADKKTVLAISREVRDLAARAKKKQLRPEEMTDGTFSISNLGMFGIDEFAAVINPPEGAILAVGRVRSEPVVWEGAVVPGQRMALTLSCDHRVVDGAVGARFLAELRSLLERPTQMLVV